MVLEHDTAAHLGVFELIKVSEGAVDECGIRQRTEILSRLRLGELAGRKSRSTCSGTRSVRLMCQPACALSQLK